LSALAEQGSLSADQDAVVVTNALRSMLQRVREVTDRDGAHALLTVMTTNGRSLVATQGGKELYISTYKTRCSDRAVCPSLSAACEAPSTGGPVNHFIVSSEPLQGENVWQPLALGDVVGVDERMRVFRARVDHVALPVVA